MAAATALAEYQRKRDFAQTPEPRGERSSAGDKLSFVIQKHAARSLHYDFRLELDGTLKSWAVPKGPSLDPAVRRMAVQVEDHPVSYAGFEGTIPQGHYGAGTVIVWDRGDWTPVGDARAGLRDGHLKFDLAGEKLRGRWALVRMKLRANERQPSWLLIKDRDDQARPIDEFDVVEAEPDSVLTRPTSSNNASAKTAAETRAVADVRVAPTAREQSRSGKAAKTRNTKLPEFLAPQLATLVDAVPPGDDWLYEIKFDGYRVLTRIEGDSVRCITRNGNDWSAKLPALVDAIRACQFGSCWLDGEIVVLDAKGVPDFQALQNAFDARSTSSIVYFVFDLPFHADDDLRALPLSDRRARLKALLADAPDPSIRFSDDFADDPHAMLESAAIVGLEGLIGKRAQSPYRSARSADWIKLKTQKRQEFVIGGYTDPQGSRTGIGSLLLGVHDDDGTLRYAGNVGTGFDETTLAALKQRLAKLHASANPFVDATGKSAIRGDAHTHWVRPTLSAEVSFAQWTTGGRVRHAVFRGLREDKPAADIVQERPQKIAASERKKKLPAAPVARPSKSAPAAASKATPPDAATVNLRVTHPDRVIDATTGITKGELADYYDRVAGLMLPHLKARPVALVRAPAGVAGSQFFQKHADDNELPGIELQDESLDPGHEALLVVASARGLRSAAQMNAVELHTWNMTIRTMPRPDRMVFDLDPGEGVEWPAMREAARLVQSFLDDLGLSCLLKTSGGKGVHVVVPLAPKHDWQTVRQASEAVVAHLASVIPQRFVAKSGARNRVGKIFVDYLRNGWGSTTASAWSARARPGLGVSVPIDWSELDSIASAAHWHLRNVGARLAAGNDPWASFAASRQTLTKAMKALGIKPSGGAE